jgi:nucleoside-diphosphate-sugar epimerase
MKILILGNGLIGKSIISRLESEGHELQIYSKKSIVNTESKQILGNIFDFENFIKIFTWKPQIVIHTAWVTQHGTYQNDSSNFEYAQFTSDLARYIVHTSVEHLIVLGSCAEYGYQVEPSTAGITLLKPESIYAEQKVAAFKSAQDSLSNSGVRLSWVRVFHPYGQGQDGKRLIPYLIDSLHKRKQIVLTDTSSRIDWITTRDISAAISWIINHDLPIELDIGTSIGFTNIELLKHLEGIMGNSEQWRSFTENANQEGRMSLVGPKSPLLASGWRASDNLTSGLEWMLSS